MNNFLQNPDFQKQLREKIAHAQTNLERLKKRGPHSLGDAYFFKESRDLPVRWVAILQHVDNPSLWYLVAADEYHGVGTCDVELPPKHAWAPMVLRCGVGFWAHKKDLTLQNYAGRLQGEPLDDARIRLSEMVQGTVPMPQSDLDTDEDPHYCDWMEELHRVADSIEARLQAEPMVVLRPTVNALKTWLSDVVAKVPDSITGFRKEFDRPVDGMRGGLEPALAASYGDVPPAGFIPDGVEIPTGQIPGCLVLLKDADCYELVYYPQKNDDPKPAELIFSSSSDVVHGEWLQPSDGQWHWSKPLSATDGKIELQIGDEYFSVEAF